MLLVPCNRKSGCDDLGCLGPWDGFAPIPRIIKWKGLRLTWNKGGGKSQEIWFFPNYAVRASSPLHSSCIWPCILANMLNLHLLFSALLQELGFLHANIWVRFL